MTNGGINLFINRLYAGAGSTQSGISKFKFGTGTTTPAATDTDLEASIATNDIASGFPVFDTANKKVTVWGRVTVSQGNGSNITEVGEFNTDGTAVMASRDVFTAIAKDSSTEILVKWVHRTA